MSHIEADIVLQRSAAAPLATSSGPSEPRTAAVASARPAPTGAGSSGLTHGQPVTGLQEDVDDKYRNDPQMVTHYVNQIHDYLREAQVRIYIHMCVFLCVTDDDMQSEGEMWPSCSALVDAWHILTRPSSRVMSRLISPAYI